MWPATITPTNTPPDTELGRLIQESTSYEQECHDEQRKHQEEAEEGNHDTGHPTPPNDTAILRLHISIPDTPDQIIHAYYTQTIQDITQHTHRLTGIPPDQQRLTYGTTTPQHHSNAPRTPNPE